MNYNIIQTGSKGNCVLINDFIAIDMGIPFTKIKPYYKQLKIVFISHEHQDHLLQQTIKKLAELRPTLKFIVADYLVQNLYDAGVSKKNIISLATDIWYDFNAFKCKLTPTVHDVPNVAIHLEIKGKKLLYATDTATLDCIQAKNYNYYLVEGNYDEEEIEIRKQEKIKNEEFVIEDRIKNTHTSIQECNRFLIENMGNNSECVYLHQHIDNDYEEEDEKDAE